MNSAKITAGLAAVVAVISISVAVHEYQAARNAEQALSDAKRASAPKIAEPVRVASTQEVSKSTPEQDADSQAKATTTAAAKPSETGFGAVVALLSNPAIQKQIAMQTRARLDRQFMSLFKSLNLSPDQLERFKGLFVERQLVIFDAIAAAHEQGIDPNTSPQGFFQVVAGAASTVNKQISALVGEQGLGQLKDFEKTVPAQNTSSMLRDALVNSPTPLTTEQINKLIPLLTQYGSPVMPTDNPFFVLQGDLGIVSLSEKALPLVQAILSEAQINALKESMQQQHQMFEDRKTMMPSG